MRSTRATLTDHWLGVFLERLDELGLRERTLVVVFSDHGVSLADSGLASLHDIVPTVLSVAGIPVPHAMEGIDLTPLLAGARPARERDVQTAAYNDHVWAGTAELSFIATGRAHDRRLFDRVEDPRERRNVAGARRGEAGRLWKRVLNDAGRRSLPRYD